MPVKGHIVKQNVEAKSEEHAKERITKKIHSNAVNCDVFISDMQVISEEGNKYQVECSFSVSGELNDVERFSINSGTV